MFGLLDAVGAPSTLIAIVHIRGDKLLGRETRPANHALNAFGDEIFHAFAFGEQVIHAGLLFICLDKIAARFEFGEVGNCAGHGFVEDARSLFGEEDLGVIADSLFLRNDI